MAGVCWRCQMLYQRILFCLLIFLPTQVCLLFLFSCCFFTSPACQKPFFLLSMIAIPRSDIGDASNAIQNVGPIIFMSVLMFMCIHHSEKKIRFLFGLCLAIVPFRQLKAFRLTTILCFLFLSQWHSDVIPLWGMSKEVRSLLWVPRVF